MSLRGPEWVCLIIARRSGCDCTFCREESEFLEVRVCYLSFHAEEATNCDRKERSHSISQG
jgi:hypothetical protein